MQNFFNCSEFDTKNITLANTFKVDESVFVEEFLPKVLKDRSTIVVVDKTGDIKGYINEKQLAFALDKSTHHG